MQVRHDAELPSLDPASPDPPLWHALRPELRSSALGWADLKALAARQYLRPDDYIWHPAWETWRAAGEVPGLIPSSAPTGSSHLCSTVPQLEIG